MVTRIGRNTRPTQLILEYCQHIVAPSVLIACETEVLIYISEMCGRRRPQRSPRLTAATRRQKRAESTDENLMCGETGGSAEAGGEAAAEAGGEAGEEASGAFH